MALLNLIKKYALKNWIIIFCIAIIILQFSQIIYFKRASFSKPYDATYWKDRFEHSQYVLPASRRIIGDDGLYSYAGYRLLNGASIESVISDKPPVGIYVAGLSIFVFNNPILGELFLGIGTLICFYLLAFELLKNKMFALMTTTMLALEPLIFSTFYITLLDLPQLLFLLLHLLLFLYIFKTKKYGWLIALISGLSLGLFAETKPPIPLPIILTLEVLYMYKEKSLFKLMPIAFGFLIGALVPYFRYFQIGHSIIDYLKLHKYMASIYLSGHKQLFPLSIWQSLFIGYFPDVVSGKLTKINEWWIFLPIVTLIGTIGAIKTLFTKELVILKGLVVFLFSLLAIYTIIPIYPRYLILIIPFLYIFSALLLKKHIFKPVFLTIFILFAIAGFCYSTSLLLPSDDAVQDFKYNFSHKYFQDIYQQDISTSSKKPYSEQQFRKISQEAMIDANIKEVNFKELSRSIPLMGKTGKVKYIANYTTENLGKFSEEKTINLIKENGQWKIIWNWDALFNSFVPGDTFVTQILPGTRGSIIDSKGTILAQDTTLFLISINPSKIDTKREQQMLKTINLIARPPIGYLQNAYLENPLPNTFIPIATAFTHLDIKEQKELDSYPGLLMTPHISRIYDGSIKNTEYDEYDTKIYSSSNYHGDGGLEKQYDKELSGHDGGSLLMLDKDNQIIRTLTSRNYKNGQNVTLQ